MIYNSYYNSPIGKILIVSKNNKLIGVWMEGQKYFLNNIKEEMERNENDPIIIKTKEWLNRYFKGEKPDIKEFKGILDPNGSSFAKDVWRELCKIPYGKTMTYGEIAKIIAKKNNKKSMSAQAVGGAVGHNPISIIIPCHRVIGANGSLTGYAGGIDKKIKLLEIEKVNIKKV